MAPALVGRGPACVLILCAALAAAMIAACGPEIIPPGPLQDAFDRLKPVTRGRLRVDPVKFTHISRNIEDERWEAALRITSHADLDTLCNVTLRIFDAEGWVLQEYIIFNDAVPYKGTVNHSDIFFVERKAKPLVASAGFEFNCVMAEILEE